MPFDGLGYGNSSTIQTNEVSSLYSERLWERSAQKKLIELSQLPENWNSYGSKPVLPFVIKNAARLISECAQLDMPEPEIFPVAGGGIQIEWHRSHRDLEIELLPDLSIEILFVDENDKSIETNFRKLDNLQDTKFLSFFNYLLKNGQNLKTAYALA